MKEKLDLRELVDVSLLQKLIDNFYFATGIIGDIHDRNAKSLVKQFAREEFCHLIKGTTEGKKCCDRSDLEHAEEAFKLQRPVVYQCPNGLVDFVAPIVVKGERIGAVFGGQILAEPPDLEKITEVSRKCGVDEDKLINAVKKVNIIPMKTIKAQADLLLTIAKTISSLGYQQSLLKRNVYELKALYNVSYISNTIFDSNELLKKVIKTIKDSMGVEKGLIFVFPLDVDAPNSETLIFDSRKVRTLAEISVKEFESEIDTAQLIRARRQPILFDLSKGKSPVSGSYQFNFSEDTQSYLGVPMLSKEEVFGVIILENRKDKKSFSDADLNLLTNISTQVSFAYENLILYELAITDGLTRLFVHRHFHERLEEEINRAKRYNSRVSMLMMDLDNFKDFNDSYGHQFGDRVLRDISNLIRSNVRECDIASRYGGEEFAIMLPQAEKDKAVIVANRIKNKIEKHRFDFQNKDIFLTISVGVSSFPDEAYDKNSLIEIADKRLYEAKRMGRNRVVA